MFQVRAIKISNGIFISEEMKIYRMLIIEKLYCSIVLQSRQWLSEQSRGINLNKPDPTTVGLSMRDTAKESPQGRNTARISLDKQGGINCTRSSSLYFKNKNNFLNLKNK